MSVDLEEDLPAEAIEMTDPPGVRPLAVDSKGSPGAALNDASRPVNDAATVEVTDAFYEKYLDGTHLAIALAEVQNELYDPFVEKYREVEAIARLAPFIYMSLGMVPAN